MKSSTFGLGHGDRDETGTYVPTDINPFIAHPAYERLYHTIGIYASTLYEQQSEFFDVPQE